MSSTEHGPPTQEGLRFSEKFHSADSADSDVTFKSIDGVLFRLKKLNLAVNASGFPPTEFQTSDEAVELSETSDVLELLFQFCYPQRHPDLEFLDPNLLASLAEAAEKYEVFPAMSVCNIRMRENISRSPSNVMLYAARHGYMDIVDTSYRLVLKEPLEDIITRLPSHLVIPWILHYEQYAQILRKFIAEHGVQQKGVLNSNQRIINKYVKYLEHHCRVLQNLGKGVSALVELDKIFDCPCKSCPEELALWRTALEEDLKKIPPFHTSI